MLSEINYREKDKPPYDFVYKWSLKKQNEKGLIETVIFLAFLISQLRMSATITFGPITAL